MIIRHDSAVWARVLYNEPDVKVAVFRNVDEHGITGCTAVTTDPYVGFWLGPCGSKQSITAQNAGLAGRPRSTLCNYRDASAQRWPNVG